MNTSLEQVRDRLRREVERIERDRMKYDECAYRTPSATLDDLADAIDAHLSRTAEPVYQYRLEEDEDWIECSEVAYNHLSKQGPYTVTRILYTHPPEPARDAELPREAPLGLLVSMAIRFDHGLGVPGYYDAPVFDVEGVGHAKRLRATISAMRQLYEEVSGHGFYSPEKEASYAAMAQESGDGD